MTILRSLYISLFLLLQAAISCAQTAFSTNVSASSIGKNELLEVSYEVKNGNIDNFKQPDFSGWQVLGGPNMSSSTMIVNGQRSTSVSYQFVLKPKAPGSLTVPGTTASIDGKTMSSRPVIVVVTNKEVSHPQQQQSQSPFPGGSLFDEMLQPQEPAQDEYDGYILRNNENALEKTKANLFILVNVSKKSCYEGESITAEYKLYTRVNMNARMTRRPSFTGFSSIDLPDESHREYEIETYKGKSYRVYNVRKVQLYPLMAGNQTLQSAEIDATIEYKKMPAANDYRYDPYSASNIVSLPYTVKSEPVIITVLPLPAEGKPTGFTGVVGSFDVKASMPQKELARNEAGKFRVEISGQGNWSMVQPPAINWPKGVEVFEPTVTEQVDSQAVPVAGKRVYEYSFLCNQPGQLTVPAVSFSYFNAAQKKYVTDSSNITSVQILNKELAMPEATEEGVDNTEAFTKLVKIVFPGLAIALIVYVLIISRSKRRRKQEETHWQRQAAINDEMERKWQAARSQPVESKEPVVEAPAPATDASKYQPSFAQQSPVAVEEETVIPPTPEELAQEATPQSAEQQVPANSYFGTVKKDLLNLLQWHWQIDENNLAQLPQQLLQKGMMEEDIESVNLLIQTCDKHIYSPFGETIDKKQWDDIVSEIEFVLKKRAV